MTEPHVLEVGGYPPPYGGITVHIQRLCREAQKAGIAVRVADPFPDASEEKRRAGSVIVPLRGPSWLKFGRLVAACRVSRAVHFHGSALENLWMMGPIAPALGRPYVVSIHSGNFPGRWKEMSRGKQLSIVRLLSRAHSLVCVSDALRQFVEGLLPIRKRILVLPAFLPPARPREVHPLVRDLRASAEKIVLTSGFPLDNYGLLSFIESMSEISRERKIGTVVVLYPTSDPTNADRYRDEENRVREAVRAFTRECPHVVVLEALAPDTFASVQAGCDIFVRNTCTDGDSVALRESGHLGCQVLASDAVERPRGSLLFRAHDARALGQAIRTALEDPAVGRVESPPDTAGPILAIYRELLGSPS
jgi:glycosyltransferase involved in cell wall biosynthesis